MCFVSLVWFVFFCLSASILPSYLLSRSFKHVPAANTVSRGPEDTAGRSCSLFLFPCLAFGFLLVLLPSLSAIRVWGLSVMLCLTLALRPWTPLASLQSWLCLSDAHLAVDLSTRTSYISGLDSEQAPYSSSLSATLSPALTCALRGDFPQASNRGHCISACAPLSQQAGLISSLLRNPPSTAHHPWRPFLLAQGWLAIFGLGTAEKFSATQWATTILLQWSVLYPWEGPHPHLASLSTPRHSPSAQSKL